MAYQCNSEKRQEEDDRSKTASECKKKQQKLITAKSGSKGLMVYWLV